MTPFARFLTIALAASLSVTAARSQETIKPGPEHEVLKKMEGDWTLTMKVAGAEAKGKVAYKSEFGGLMVSGLLEGEMFGAKFTGKSMDSYDTAKKKYVSVWVDSMSGVPMMLEGTYDKEKKTMTLAGEGPGMDGKPTKYKSVAVFTDADTTNFSMYIGDTKEPTFTIVYTRKK